MQDDARKEYEAKAADLKSQLKQWEGDVAKRNGGKKPSRDDIKQNPEIRTYSFCLSRSASLSLPTPSFVS